MQPEPITEPNQITFATKIRLRQIIWREMLAEELDALLKRRTWIYPGWTF